MEFGKDVRDVITNKKAIFDLKNPIWRTAAISNEIKLNSDSCLIRPQVLSTVRANARMNGWTIAVISTWWRQKIE